MSFNRPHFYSSRTRTRTRKKRGGADRKGARGTNIRCMASEMNRSRTHTKTHSHTRRNEKITRTKWIISLFCCYFCVHRSARAMRLALVPHIPSHLCAYERYTNSVHVCCHCLHCSQLREGSTILILNIVELLLFIALYAWSLFSIFSFLLVLLFYFANCWWAEPVKWTKAAAVSQYMWRVEH